MLMRSRKQEKVLTSKNDREWVGHFYRTNVHLLYGIQQKLAVGLLTRGQDEAMALAVGGEESGDKNWPNRPGKVSIVKFGMVVLD